MDITLQTAAPVSNDVYYYIAMDTSGSTTSDGPHEELSGVNRLKNWTYYIVLDHGLFYQLDINQPNDRGLVPVPFDTTSPRFYSTEINGSTIHVVLHLDKLISTQKTIWMNFITSPYVIYADRDDIIPLDFLRPPYFNIASDSFNFPVSSFNQPQISDHTVADPTQQAADINYWSVQIYQR